MFQTEAIYLTGCFIIADFCNELVIITAFSHLHLTEHEKTQHSSNLHKATVHTVVVSASPELVDCISHRSEQCDTTY